MKKRPFVFLFVFLALGMVFQRTFQLHLSIGLLSLMVLAISILMLFIKELAWPTLGLLIIILGGVLQHRALHTPTQLPLEENQLTKVTLVPLGAPVERKWVWEADVKLIAYEREGQRIPLEEKARLQIPKEARLLEEMKPDHPITLGLVGIKSTLTQRPLNSYECYLRSKGILHILTVSKKVLYTLEPAPRGLGRLRQGLKSHVEAFLEDTLGQRQGALMKSILFGNQGYMDDTMVEAFSKSGTAHIVAVSGLHIGILVMILDKLLTFGEIGKNYRLVLILGCILGYTYLVAFPVSMVRAAGMYALQVLAYFLHRRYDALNALGLIGTVTLLFNPFALYTVSFQLSFGATLGILLFYRPLKECFKGLPQWLGGLLAVTIAAQLTTTPLIILHFQQLSLISIVTNLFIVPLLGGLLTLALGAILLGTLIPTLGGWMNYLTNLLLSYILFTVDYSAKLPFSSLQVTAWGGIAVGIYYLILLGGYCLLRQFQHPRVEGDFKNELSEIMDRYQKWSIG